jgi:putative aldouronate transport system permease protein
MAVPVLLYYLVFKYIPMYGVIIAFQKYSPTIPFFENEWRGLHNFIEFFTSVYAGRIIRNTFMLNLYGLVLGFPAPIILALMLNEVRGKIFKKTVQTVSYIPHFISTVVSVGIVLSFVSYDGVINEIINWFGGEKIQFMTEPGFFYLIYTISGIWQNIGWNSIIYLAAITAIDQNMYEAAYMDGASRWQQIWRITLPCIYPTISILLILQIGSMMSVGFEKVFLMQNPSIYEAADVISTYVYRKGLLELNYSYSAAVGFFNSIINFVLLIGANYASRRYSETSLW